MTSPGILTVRPRPRTGRVLWLVIAGVAAVLAGWFATHPGPLPTADETIHASTPVGQPVYLGVFVPDSNLGRTLHLSGVKVYTTSNVQVVVKPLLCKGGTLSVTTAPENFCTEIIDPAGSSFRPGDALLLEVRSDLPAVAVIDRVRLAYREGLQWATQEAGAPAIVNVLPR